MPFKFPSRWSAVRDFVSPFFEAYSDVWSPTDPLPAFVELVDGLVQGASAKYRAHIPGARSKHIDPAGVVNRRIEDARSQH